MKIKITAILLILLILHSSIAARIKQDTLFSHEALYPEKSTGRNLVLNKLRAKLQKLQPFSPILIHLQSSDAAENAAKAKEYIDGAEPALTAISELQETWIKFDKIGQGAEDAIAGMSQAGKNLSKVLAVFKGLGAACAILGAALAIVDLFIDKPDPMEQVMNQLAEMEERIMSAMEDSFTLLKNDNLKNMYNEAERHVHTATFYLRKMTEAKSKNNEKAFKFYSHNFNQRMEASGLDDLETIISIFSEDNYFISEPFFKSLITAYKGDNKKLVTAVEAVTLLATQAFINLHTYLRQVDKTGALSEGLGEYQDEVMEELDTYINSLADGQKDEIRNYLDANVKDVVQNTCGRFPSDPYFNCAKAILADLQESFGSVFKFSVFCFKTSGKQNLYKGVDMFFVRNIKDMDHVVFWSEPEYASSTNDKELQEFADYRQNSNNYPYVEEWDQYIRAENPFPGGYASSYPGFSVKTGAYSVWGRYKRTADDLCRMVLVDRDNDNYIVDTYNRDDSIRYFAPDSPDWKITSLNQGAYAGGDLNDDVAAIYFYGKMCEQCSVQVFNEAEMLGFNKFYYSDNADDNGIVSTFAGYQDVNLGKASSLIATCQIPKQQCKIVLGDRDPQINQDPLEIFVSPGGNTQKCFGRDDDLSDDISWLRFIGSCNTCKFIAYDDADYKGATKTFTPKAGAKVSTIVDDFLLRVTTCFKIQC